MYEAYTGSRHHWVLIGWLACRLIQILAIEAQIHKKIDSSYKRSRCYVHLIFYTTVFSYANIWQCPIHLITANKITQNTMVPYNKQRCTPLYCIAAVPNLIGTRDEFRGRQFFHPGG